MIFVNSMSDLFHEGVPDAYIEDVVRVMQEADWHTYQVLTKRSDRMRRLLNSKLCDAAGASHIWWGIVALDCHALENSVAPELESVSCRSSRCLSTSESWTCVSSTG